VVSHYTKPRIAFKSEEKLSPLLCTVRLQVAFRLPCTILQSDEWPDLTAVHAPATVDMFRTTVIQETYHNSRFVLCLVISYCNINNTLETKSFYLALLVAIDWLFGTFHCVQWFQMCFASIPWFRLLVAGLSPRRPGFHHSPFYQHDICGGQSGTGAGFSPNTLAVPCQYHSTKAP
jgi:hypothetical protein